MTDEFSVMHQLITSLFPQFLISIFFPMILIAITVRFMRNPEK